MNAQNRAIMRESCEAYRLVISKFDSSLILPTMYVMPFITQGRKKLMDREETIRAFGTVQNIRAKGGGRRITTTNTKPAVHLCSGGFREFVNEV